MSTSFVKKIGLTFEELQVLQLHIDRLKHSLFQQFHTLKTG